MGECSACVDGWLAGRKQFRLGGGRELPLLESKKKIPEQVVKRATALTLQQQQQSVLLSGKKEKLCTWERKKASSELLAAHNIVHTAYQV